MTQIWRPDAPFRQYKTTDEEARADGYKTGLEWPAKWNHVPGGPHVCKIEKGDHPDWVEYCHTLRRHHNLWIQGWYEGFKENARTNPDIAALRTTLLLNKLAA